MSQYAKTIVTVLIGVLTVVQAVLVHPPVGIGGWISALAGPLLTILGVFAIPNSTTAIPVATTTAVPAGVPTSVPATPTTAPVAPTGLISEVEQVAGGLLGERQVPIQEPRPEK